MNIFFRSYKKKIIFSKIKKMYNTLHKFLSYCHSSLIQKLRLYLLELIHNTMEETKNIYYAFTAQLIAVQ